MIKYSLVIFMLLMIGCSEPPRKQLSPNVSWDNCYSTFEKHVLELSGNQVRDCGFFTPITPENKKAEVKGCLKSALENGEPFRVGHKDIGYDSSFCAVAVKDTKGKYWSFFYDSSVSGSSKGPAALWISQCSELKLEKGTIGQDSFFKLVGCEERKDVVKNLLKK